MKLFFNGAAQTVTGSQHLLEVNGHTLLLECGLFQGRRADTYTKNLNFPYRPSKVDAVILSHAHIDHSGNLPNLVKQGYAKKIYATAGTCALADLMLRDSGHIQESDAAFVNKRRAKRGDLTQVEPLYTLADAAEVEPLLRKVDYNQPFEPVPGVTARLVDAGHILGSAAVVLDIKENGRKFRLWFSGDIGRLKLPLLKDPILPEAADYLIMESTYGDKEHRDPELAFQELRKVLLRTFRRGGKLIVPAFAVGRTQELVYSLNRLITEGEIPSIPVYVDSPLAVNATDIFSQFPEYFDAETHAFIRAGKHPALWFPNLTYTRSVEESKEINEKHGPLVIISASGMAENGRILHHLRNNIEDGRNTIAIVSWQAPETLGRRLAEGNKRVKIYGEEFPVAAEVVSIDGLSAHAGQDYLEQYAAASKVALKHIFLVHGEEKPATALMEKIKENQSTPIQYPSPGTVATL